MISDFVLDYIRVEYSTDKRGNVVFKQPVALDLLFAALDAEQQHLIVTARAEAIAVINALAGAERAKYATNIPFQGDLYQLKEREAQLFQSDSYPSAEIYPILYAEATARNITPAALAAEYLANAALFPCILASIEGVRMGAIAAIKNAASIAEIEAALTFVTWPEF